MLLKDVIFFREILQTKLLSGNPQHAFTVVLSVTTITHLIKTNDK